MKVSLLTKMPCGVMAPLRPMSAPKPCSGRVATAHVAAIKTHAPFREIRSRAMTAESSNGAGAADMPEPVVKIDNQTDAFSTVVTVEFGDRLGELVDTVAALKNIGLNIRRAKLQAGAATGGGGSHKFYITDARTSEKVIKSARIEELRLTILNCMLQYHPESGEKLAIGPSAVRGSVVREFDPTRPFSSGVRQNAAVTQIEIREHESGAFTEILVNTLDRPGLLTSIVHTLKDINLNVVSAEVDTIGRNAVDVFNVTYHGEPLPQPMCQLAVNALQYYLSQGDVEKEYTESY